MSKLLIGGKWVDGGGTEKLKDKYSIASDYGNLALVYESMKKYPLALEYVTKAMAIDKEINDMK